jgi:L-Ala-D/L-Glu epimerase
MTAIAEVADALTIVVAEVREVTWQLDLVGPAARLSSRTRHGALLRVTATHGVTGIGEASPLLDALALPHATWAALHRWADAPAATICEASDCARIAALAAADTPAARFAIETALLDALANARGVSLAQLLAAAPRQRVALNAVVSTLEQAQQAVRRGISTLKLKLGTDTDQDARLVAVLRKHLGQRIRLRGDANQCWPASEVGVRMAALAAADFEYLEEPCPELVRALASADDWTIPVAIDESAHSLDAVEVERLLGDPRTGALVVKPTAVGGFAASMALAEIAARNRKPTVVTHALEGPVATAACAELARALAGGAFADLAVGLDHHPGLAAWQVDVPQLGAPQRSTGELRAASGVGLGFGTSWPELVPTSERQPS